MEGWMGEEETDMRLSYGTRHNLSFCVISSPPDPCTFLPFPSIQPQNRAPQYVQGAFTNAGPVEKAMLVNLPLFSSDHHFLLYYSDTDISVIFMCFLFS